MTNYHPRFIFAYLLWKAEISKYLTFRRGGVKFNFSKSVLALNMFANKAYVQYDFDLLDRFLHKNETFIDIGANIGTFTLYASKLVGSEGKVLTFEPHPKFYNFMLYNIKLNGFQNIDYHNVGLSNENSELYFSENLDSMNHILTQQSNDSIKVKVHKLDDYTEAYKIIDLIKIDIEGYELFCLKGALSTLKKTRKVIFESNNSFTRYFGYSTFDIIRFLNELDFEVYKMSDIKFENKLNDTYLSTNHEDLIAINKKLIG